MPAVPPVGRLAAAHDSPALRGSVFANGTRRRCLPHPPARRPSSANSSPAAFARSGPLHEHLADLAGGGAFAAILDPNYDLLLRRALQHRRVPHTASVLEHNLARPGEGLWYLSFHGSVDDWTQIVLTGESYRDFAERHRFLQAALDLLLLRHPVLFVGASLTDPRLLEWLDGLPEAKRHELKTWLAVVGPGTPRRLEETPWRDGRTVRQALGEHLRLVELPDFAALTAWFAELAEPARRKAAAAERDLTISLTAEPERWTFRAAGAESCQPPPDLGDDLAALRRMAGAGFPVDAAGEPLPEARGVPRHPEGLQLLAEAWEGGHRHQDLVNLLETGPRLAAALLRFGRAGEATEVAARTRDLAAGLPADHPLRREVEAALPS